MSSGEHAATKMEITKRHEALLRVSQTLISIRSSEELFRVLARELRDVVSFYVMGVGIYDEKAHEMNTTSYGEPGLPLQAPKFAPEETFSWWVYQHQQPLIIPSLDAETRFPAVAKMLKNSGVRSVCALPLTTVHRRLGGVAFGSTAIDAYSSEEVSFLALVANQVALAVDDALNFEASQRAKEAVRASEESFRLIVDSIPAFAWYASPDGKIEYLNQRILDFTGERQENLVGFGWANVLHPEDVESTKKAWLHSVETGEPCEVDQRVRRFDNVYRWFRTNAQPLRDYSGRVIRWYGVATEIEDWKRAEDALRRSEESFRLAIAGIPGLVNTMSPSGELEFANQRWLDYHGKTLEEMKSWETSDIIHPDDLSRTTKAWKGSVETGQPFEDEYRIRGADGLYRWFQGRSLPLRDGEGRIIHWHSLITDIDDRKRAEEALRRSEAYLAEAQKLSHTGSFGWHVSSGEIYWSQETFGIFGYEPAPKATIEMVVQRTHPDDRPLVQQLIDRVSRALTPFDFEHRLLLPDGSVRHVRVIGHPSKDESGESEFVGAVTDITERKRGDLLLRESEQQFRAIFNEAGSGITLVDLASGAPIENNRALQTMLGCSRDELSRFETFDELTCEEDRESDAMLFRELCDGKRETLREEKHFILRDGRSVWANVIFTLLRDSEGRPRNVIAIHEDITERKQAEEKLKRSDASLTEAQRLSHCGSWSWDLSTREGFWSPEMFRILGYDPEKTQASLAHFLARVHPEDRPMVEEVVKQEMKGLEEDLPSDYRIVLPDGTIKHLHAVAHPMTNRAGEVVAVIGTSMDVTEQRLARAELENAFESIKRLKDRLQDENLELREQIDQVFMFEEIVGSSPALKAVLQSIRIVAPADSTVLIQGETGTGKEMIARAIHKLSPRKDQAFVKVNCAAIPLGLLESELFGHERGAFTGAVTRKVGRFEAANQGTLFLDEVGDIPPELQPKLLRVLQNGEFERLGSTQTQRANVRLIAATNKDLAKLVAQNQFRSDLYYRLNAFPIPIPPLRHRSGDIPLLVTHFVGIYSERMNKQIAWIPREAMEALIR